MLLNAGGKRIHILGEIPLIHGVNGGNYAGVGWFLIRFRFDKGLDLRADLLIILLGKTVQRSIEQGSLCRSALAIVDLINVGWTTDVRLWDEQFNEVLGAFERESAHGGGARHLNDAAGHSCCVVAKGFVWSVAIQQHWGHKWDKKGLSFFVELAELVTMNTVGDTINHRYLWLVNLKLIVFRQKRRCHSALHGLHGL